MISIDFGSSYTKVAIRCKPDTPTRLLRDEDHLLLDGGLHICVPSVVAVTADGTFLSGTEVQQHSVDPKDPVLRNWKSRFFRPGAPEIGEPGVAQPPKARSIFGLFTKRDPPDDTPPKKENHAEFQARVIQTLKLTTEQIESFINFDLNSDHDREAARYQQDLLKVLKLTPLQRDAFFASPHLFEVAAGNQPPPALQPAPVSVGDPGDIPPDKLFLNYFRWLRQYVSDCAARNYGIDIHAMPVRIMVPNINDDTTRPDRAVELLSKAGWNPDPNKPFIFEPLANAIGIITQGWEVLTEESGKGTRTHISIAKNAVIPDTDPPQPQLREMLGRSDVFKQAINYLSNKANTQKYYWWLSVDVGGFTTDCSMLGIDVDLLESNPVDFKETDDRGRKLVCCSSQPLGVNELDRRVLKHLPELQSTALNRLMAGWDQNLLEDARKRLYSRETTIPAGGIDGVEIGADAGHSAIVDQLGDFGREAAEHVIRFLDENNYDRVNTLSLTGGGLCIPRIGRTLVSSLMDSGKLEGFRYLMSPEYGEKEVNEGRHRPLENWMVRGGTSLGGGSLLFDVISRALP